MIIRTGIYATFFLILTCGVVGMISFVIIMILFGYVWCFVITHYGGFSKNEFFIPPFCFFYLLHASSGAWWGSILSIVSFVCNKQFMFLQQFPGCFIALTLILVIPIFFSRHDLFVFSYMLLNLNLMLMLSYNSFPGNKEVHRQRQPLNLSPDPGSSSGGVAYKDSVS